MASVSNATAVPLPKRKTEEGGHGKTSGVNRPSSSSKMVQLAPGDELNLQRTTKKPGEGAVTKRTLQNRKAQREFRKRREARVRELEERCRRYDQMGIEANSELQRFARNLKEENEALRNFIVRIGCGNAIPSLLDGIASQGPNTTQHASFAGNPQQVMDQQRHQQQQQQRQSFGQPTPRNDQQQAIFGGMFGNNGPMTGGTFSGNQPQLYSGTPSDDKASKADSGQGQGGQRALNSKKGDARNEESDAPLLSLNLASDGSSQEGQKQQRQQPEFAPNSTHTSQKLDQRQDPGQFISPSGTGLTAYLANQAQQPNGGDNSTGSGLGGTAMLFGGFGGNAPINNSNNNSNNNNNGNSMQNTFGMPGTFAPVPIPQRSQQNAALLNPNPIPFAFNLSNNELNAQAPATWWEQMGSGNDNVELDEKAQALANAQANGNGGTQSPFDLSTFLNGGVTPGGGFQWGNTMDTNSPSLQSDSQGNAHTNATLASDTEHMRMFINLIERKVAEREARTVAALGFQPPSQDPAHRKLVSAGKLQDPRGRASPQTPTLRVSKSLTPSGVYTRLAQHPAFLSTNEREMEELVDALGHEDSAARSTESGRSNKAGRSRASSSVNPRQGNGSSPSQASQDTHVPSPPSKSQDDGRVDVDGADEDADEHRSNVHVDEGAIGKLFGLLDQKRGSGSSGSADSIASGSNFKAESTENAQQQQSGKSYTMTMA